MDKLFTAIDGKKTYIIALISILAAWASVWAGSMTQQQAIEATMGALGMASLRHGVEKSVSLWGYEWGGNNGREYL